jgi:hypothetical protein
VERGAAEAGGVERGAAEAGGVERGAAGGSPRERLRRRCVGVGCWESCGGWCVCGRRRRREVGLGTADARGHKWA